MEEQYSQGLGRTGGAPTKNKRNQLFIAIGIAFVFAIAVYAAWQFFIAQPADEVAEEAPAPAQKEEQQERQDYGTLPKVQSTSNPLENSPDLNPVDKINPFRNVKTNPFE